MDEGIRVQPLPYKRRQQTFLLLLLIFVVALPFLYLHATGYRFSLLKPTNIVSTGGMYIAVDRTGAEIFIDGELVRETRTFRKAFYAQNLDVGTHRVHVQKEGYHTWVKELPVSEKLVTEALAFNMPLVPQVRVISPWKSATGTTVVSAFTLAASSTNELIATSTKQTKQFTPDPEFQTLVAYFSTTSTSSDTGTRGQQIKELILGSETPSVPSTTPATTTLETATTTKASGGVKLFEKGEDVYASWIGSFEQMPYYYCAPDFPRYSTTSTSTFTVVDVPDEVQQEDEVVTIDAEDVVMHPVQTVSKDTVCDPTIRLDRKWQQVQDFHFFPGSTDLVILTLEDGVYVVEIDDRGWQNMQPLLLGRNFRTHIENGSVYTFDGVQVYHIVIRTE